MAPSYLALSLTLVALLTQTSSAHSLKARSHALDKTITNEVPDAPGAPTLYYNGSGPVPGINTTSPEPPALPNLSTQEIENAIVQEVYAIGSGTAYRNDSCTQCMSAIDVLHIAALTQSQDVMTNIMISICNKFPDLDTDHGTCESYFSGTGGLGPWYAQLFQKMTFATGDMHAFCIFYLGYCDTPPAAVEINEDDWFPPKPANRTTAPAPSGETINVVHFSDWHMDPRYDPGSEANCTSGLCCRFDSVNDVLMNTSQDPSLPASRFGDYLCDSPADLAISAMNSMHTFLNLSSVAYTIYTGDIVSHDQTDQQSRALTEYEETTAYKVFKAQLGHIPIYPTLGNHDSIPSGFNTPNSFRNDTSNEMSWNYQLPSSLWAENGWIKSTTQDYAAQHYGAYSLTTKLGLKVISISTDFWYTPNAFNYYNYTNPDKSGILKFLIE